MPTIGPATYLDSQRMEHLELANRVRMKRARLKKDLKAGRVNVTDIILEPPELLDTMTVFDLLRSIPKHSQVKATAVLRKCDVSPSRTMGSLTEREKSSIVSKLYQH